MNLPPRIKVVAVEAWEQPFHLRLPFRFGTTTLTQGRQALVRVRIALPGDRTAEGYAAETLSAKWFDKNPALTDEQNYDQLRRSIELAREAYLGAGTDTAFGLFANQHHAWSASGRAQGLNALTQGFGPALVDRAILDALCRHFDMSFWQAMHVNLPGMRPHPLVADLDHFDFDGFLRGLKPATHLNVRHTVGLVDPIVAADLSPADHVNDGLPVTLEEFVAAQGLHCFKIKLDSHADRCLGRLRRIAATLASLPHPYLVTLDGNEQFASSEAFEDLWSRMNADPELDRLVAATAMIEQPIARALTGVIPMPQREGLPPFLIDESDDGLASFVVARRLGYRGVSSKGCKGFYKSLLNLARCHTWNADQAAAGHRYFMSAEDLTTLPGLCLQQDLALAALLGVAHIERNAQHYIDGFSGQPVDEALAYQREHPDLYGVPPIRPRLTITAGRIAFASLAHPGFGSNVQPNTDQRAPMPVSLWAEQT